MSSSVTGGWNCWGSLAVLSVAGSRFLLPKNKRSEREVAGGQGGVDLAPATFSIPH